MHAIKACLGCTMDIYRHTIKRPTKNDRWSTGNTDIYCPLISWLNRSWNQFNYYILQHEFSIKRNISFKSPKITQKLPIASRHITASVREAFKDDITVLVCCLTHSVQDEIDAISQTTFSNAFSWMTVFGFRLKFHCNLFLRVHLTIYQHWFR